MRHREQQILSIYRQLKARSFFIFIVFVLLLITGCRYPVQPINLPTYGVASPIGQINSPAAPNPTDTQTPGPTLTASLTSTSTEAPTSSPTQTFTSIPTDTSTPKPTQTDTPEPTLTATPRPLVFAAIGDYGGDNNNEQDVANLIKSWGPDFIITLGDNNYPNGAADHIDQAIGKYFHSYIYPYLGSFGAGADVNRFFPSIGNHDLMTDAGRPYYDYFSLPGNERYYDFTWGPVHLFALNDVGTEPDGLGVSSIQADWLRSALASSTSAWNIVYMHYPPYSSGAHGSTDWAQWPYEEWGANAVLAGHDHIYERLEEFGVTYFVVGLGGYGIYEFPNIVEGSQVRYNGDYGALRIEATDSDLLFEFINRSGELIDSYELSK